MPEKKTLQRARRAKAEGKAPTTQAGEFVREEMEHAKKGKHPVRSRKQAIAIGLSKARRSGVKVPGKAGARKGSAAKRGGAGRARGAKKRAGATRGTKRATASRASGPRSTTRGGSRGGTRSGSRRAGSTRKTSAAKRGRAKRRS